MRQNCQLMVAGSRRRCESMLRWRLKHASQGRDELRLPVWADEHVDLVEWHPCRAAETGNLHFPQWWSTLYQSRSAPFCPCLVSADWQSTVTIFLRFWSGAVNVTDKLLSFSNIYCFISRQKMPLWRYFHSRQIQTLWTRQTIAQHLLMPLWVCLSNDCIEGNCTDRVLCSIGSMYSQNCPFPSGI